MNVSFTTLITAWGCVGPVAGILIGHYLLRSGERKKWVAENKIQEWRELMSRLTASYATIARICGIVDTPEAIKDIDNARIAVFETISNRIFIGEEIRRREIPEKWGKAVQTFVQDHDIDAFAKSFRDLTDVIGDTARADISKL